MPAEQVDSLRATLETEEWRKLARGSGEPAPNDSLYTIVGGGRTVRVYGHYPMSKILSQVWSLLEDIRIRAWLATRVGEGR